MAPRRVAGILLVGGASRRFGSPKALARFRGETLAERAWRILGEAFAERFAVGKAGELPLPFSVLDDGADVRAPLAGIVAGLRAAEADVAVFLPVDLPLADAPTLRALAGACREAAVTQAGPLPAAVARSALPELEAHLARGALRVGDALAALDTAVVEVDPALLANVNEPADLARLSGDGGG
ncbi:MAG TPA: molybdenum cofactor guanylyltransferase [Gaiellaceae bacterium]|nr:molybdenum cofactor guanylyltransferase [Gaiellaceae bacterium]